MTYTVIAENDESQWSDETGSLYHFPGRYLKMLEPGTRVIYYKGKLRDKQYQDKRLSDHPHYFATAVIGKVYPDPGSERRKAYFATIKEYTAGETIKVDPETDLIPVCPNCHTLIHRRHDKTLSVEEVKAMLK